MISFEFYSKRCSHVSTILIGSHYLVLNDWDFFISCLISCRSTGKRWYTFPTGKSNQRVYPMFSGISVWLYSSGIL